MPSPVPLPPEARYGFADDPSDEADDDESIMAGVVRCGCIRYGEPPEAAGDDAADDSPPASGAAKFATAAA